MHRGRRTSRLRAHGSKPKYYHKVIGGNFRLDTLQAAVVSAKLPHLDDWMAACLRNAERYNQLLSERVACRSQTAPEYGAQGNQLVLPIPAQSPDRSSYLQPVCDSDIGTIRDQLKTALQEKGVGTEIYYPVPMHLQECFAYLGHKTGAFPESESAAKETLALPIYPELGEAQIRHVVGCIREFRSGRPSGSGVPRKRQHCNRP